MASHAPLVSNPPNLRNCREVGAYRRRRPEERVLYRVVQQQLETFLARAQARDRPVPRFVERDEAERAEPIAEYAWDGVRNLRLLSSLQESVTVGVY